MTNLNSSPAPYVVYPGCTLGGFVMELMSSCIMLESFCANNRITPVELLRMTYEVLSGWVDSKPRHNTRQEAIMHFMNTLKLKIHDGNNRNNTRNGNGSLASRLPQKPECGLIE